MKNREYLNGQNLCDMLCEINKPIIAYRCDCIMEALADESRVDRCTHNHGNCRECIAAWLNEERK